MNPHQAFEKAFLIHGYTAEDQDEKTGKITIKLSPNDTRCLAAGVYYYTVKLQRGGSVLILCISGSCQRAKRCCNEFGPHLHLP